MRIEEKYHVIFNTLAEGITVQDSQGQIVDLNPCAESILGLTKKQMIGRTNIDPRWQAVYEDGSPYPGEAHPAMITLKTGVPQRNAILGVHKPDGTLTWISINTEPLFEEDQELPSGVVASFIDVTEKFNYRIHLEKQLKWAHIRNTIINEVAKHIDFSSICNMAFHSLHRYFKYNFGFVGLINNKTSEIRLISIYPNDHPLSIELKPPKIIKIPEGIESLHYSKPDKVYTLHLSELPDDFEKKIFSRILDILKTQKVKSIVLLPLSADGKLKAIMGIAFVDQYNMNEYEDNFFEAMRSSIMLALEKEEMFKEIQRSYSELKQTQESMLEQERLNAMGQMASGIAHDINNTLSPISLYTEALIEGEEDLSDRSVRYIKSIQSATKDIEHTINRLRLFYRKPDTDRTEWNSINIRELFVQIIDMTCPRWEDISQKGGITIQLDIEVPENDMFVYGFESEIRESLVNLVFNAIDAMPKGGRIVLRSRKIEKQILIEVDDSGIGMDAENKKRCLEPFFTTKGNKGTGLGLASVLGVMERHHGEIEIESEEGSGTTVRLIFPDIITIETMQESQETSPPLPSLNLLCIDDEAIVRDGLKDVLEIEGHHVVTATSGEEGINKVHLSLEQQTPFDAVITDLGMPEMDGWEVAGRIKEKMPDIPILMISGWGNLMNGTEEVPQDVDAILGKPPKIHEIKKVLSKLLLKNEEEERFK